MNDPTPPGPAPSGDFTRRRFILTGAAGAALTTLPQASQAQSTLVSTHPLQPVKSKVSLTVKW